MVVTRVDFIEYFFCVGFVVFIVSVFIYLNFGRCYDYFYVIIEEVEIGG